MENAHNYLLDIGAKIIKLTQNHEIKPFDCGVEDLNNFLFDDAKIHAKHLNHTTFVIETKDHTIAYYSLANDSYKVDSVEEFREDMSEHDLDPLYEEFFFEQRSYPSAKIGRLAVDTCFQRKGIGRLIIDSLIHGFVHDNKTGCQFITIDCIKDDENKALTFYRKNGFELLQNERTVCRDSWFLYRCLLPLMD